MCNTNINRNNTNGGTNEIYRNVQKRTRCAYRSGSGKTAAHREKSGVRARKKRKARCDIAG